jgi:serine phosphatase RsbU (regulator of sigma subunit)
MRVEPQVCSLDLDTRNLASPQEAKILLFEDNEAEANLVAARLGQVDTAYHLDRANSLYAGKQRLQSCRYDAVLLDLNLPDSTGLATFELLHEAFPDVPVIVLTGLDDREMATKAVRGGAQDYVSKANADGETLDRAIRYSRERVRRRTTERNLQHLQEEITATRKIQQFLHPKIVPYCQGWDIAGDCRPADVVGGDFFDVFSIGSGQLGVVVADVSGHGFGPALIMAETRCLVRTLARAHADPAEVLTVVNKALLEDTPEDVFVTLFLALIDIDKHTLVYGSAGHECYLINAAGEVTALASTTGYPLGIHEDSEFSRIKLGGLESGDVLVMLTDGFQEAWGPNDKMFGIERALAVVKQVCEQPARQILDVLFDTVLDYCRPDIPHDDLTAVIVKVL